MARFRCGIRGLLVPRPWKRILFFMAGDIAIMAYSLYVSFLLRFGFVFPLQYRRLALFWLAVIVLFNVVILAFLGLYSISWRFCGLTEFYRLISFFALSLAVFSLFNFLLRSQQLGHDIPFGVILMTALLSFVLISLLRFSKSLLREMMKRSKPGLRTMIVGANISSERLIRELRSQRDSRFSPVVIVDEDPERIGTRISGVKVVAGPDRVKELIGRYQIEALIITLSRSQMRIKVQVFDQAREAGVKHIKVIPKIDDCDSGVFLVKNFRNIDIEDLLCRPEVKINLEELKKFFRDRTIFVSGAAGTIGSEIVHKLIGFGVAKLIAYEIDETEIFNLHHELRQTLAGRAGCFVPVVGDIRDGKKLKRILAAHRPDMIFHAAAYKHVPLMEDFPEEAVKTNIFGTDVLARAAVECGVTTFVNISTDKAVNPSGIMGASKRAAEIICRSLNSQRTRFISVRFGNVLGSRGSVIPLFMNQIKQGGPLTVTDPEMKRFFMATSEAVLLVFQAAYQGHGGEVFVLDMGSPVRILDLAEKLVRLNGFEPYRDIEIVFTGLRPGEKLFEELLTAEEGTDPTLHSQIFCVRNGTIRSEAEVRAFLEELENGIATKEQIERVIADFLPYFKGKRKAEAAASRPAPGAGRQSHPAAEAGLAMRDQRSSE